MIRTWKLLVLPAAATILFAGSTLVFAEEQAEGKAAVDKIKQAEKRLEGIEKRFTEALADVQQAMGQLESARARVEHLGKQLADAKNDLNQLRGDGASGTTTTQALYPPEQASMEAIVKRLAKIEQDLARLTNPPRVSLYPAPPPPPTGRLRLINDAAEEMQFVINGRSYRVAPGMAQVIDQMPAGPFTYEVVSPTWGLRGSRSPTLSAGETFTLTAHY